MARYILLEFDDNGDADDFVASIQRGGAFYGAPAKEDMDDGTQVVRVGDIVYKDVDPNKIRTKALFAKPTNFCQCQPRPENHVKGAKLGWYVCRKCAKAVAGVFQYPRNLLDPPDMPTRARELHLGVWEGADRKALEAYMSNRKK